MYHNKGLLARLLDRLNQEPGLDRSRKATASRLSAQPTDTAIGVLHAVHADIEQAGARILDRLDRADVAISEHHH